MNAESSLPFILRLRIICEIIFDMFLSTYISGLTTYYDKCEEKEDIARSLQLAEQALATFREAEALRVGRKFDLADATVERGLLALQERCDKFRICFLLIVPYSVPQYRSSAEILPISQHHGGLELYRS